MASTDHYMSFLRALDDAELVRETSMRYEHSPAPSLMWGLIDLCLGECRRRDSEAGNRLLCSELTAKHGPIMGL